MNPIYASTKIGTIGELVVQIYLLENDVQAAPPVKDSGNDLIGIYGSEFRAIQVKTTRGDKLAKPKSKVDYHVLAVVKLPKNPQQSSIMNAAVYLFRKRDLKSCLPKITLNTENLISPGLIRSIWAPESL